MLEHYSRFGKRVVDASPITFIPRILKRTGAYTLDPYNENKLRLIVERTLEEHKRKGGREGFSSTIATKVVPLERQSRETTVYF